MAFFRPADLQEAPDLGALSRYLAAKVPEFMVPSAFVEVDALPLGATGKVDRRLLVDQASGVRARGDRPYLAPRTPTEETLARIWTEVLSAERVGVHDDFFALGGHSLLATRLLARLRLELGVEVALHQLFGAATLEAQAELVETALVAAAAESGSLEELLDLLEEEESEAEEGARLALSAGR